MRNQMKDAISDAFLALSQRKSIDKITVKDIVEYCGISRQSFYYHFQDIQEVIGWYLQRMESDTSMRCQNADTFEDEIGILVEVFLANKKLLERLRDSQKRDFIEQYVANTMQTYLLKVARGIAASKPLNMRGKEAETLIRCFSFGLAGILITHAQNSAPNADELQAQIITVFRCFVSKLNH